MIHFLTHTYIGGLLTIALGLLSIKIAKINQKKSDVLNNSGVKGWFAGISLIAIGIIVIFKLLFNL